MAFGLRLYHLDFQSFWSDEGISLLRSSAPVAQMLADMPVEHMPGYFVLLHFWLKITGHHDFAIRFFSALPSMVSVALLFRLAAHLGGSNPEDGSAIGKRNKRFLQVASCSSAALLASASFQIWYAQEARMYSWLLVAGLASFLCFWQLFYSDTKSSRFPVIVFVGYVFSTLLSIYLHFYGFLVPITQAFFALGWVVMTRHWQVFFRWAGAGLLIFLLVLPWMPRMLQIGGFSGWRDPADPWQIPGRYFAAYTVGDAMEVPWRGRFILYYVGISILGLWGWFRFRIGVGFFLISGLIIPLSIVVLLALNNPDFHERYAIIISPMIALAVGGGVAMFDSFFYRRDEFGGLAEPSKSKTGSLQPSFLNAIPALLLLGSLLWGNSMALARQYTDTSLHKPDFRGAAWRIAQNERPGDVILVDGPDPEKVFLHYYRDEYRGQSPVYDLRSLTGQSWEEVGQPLSKLTDGAGRVWELLYFHGPGPVQIWTAITGWATEPTDHNDIRVTLYGMRGEPAREDPTRVEMDLAFGPSLTLISFEVSGSHFRTGDVIRVTTVWHVSAQLPDYKFSLRLLKEDGTIALARDYVPQNWIAPTSVWIVGNQATDQHGILLPPDLQPGKYNLTLRLYEAATGKPVDTEAGQDLLLQQVDIQEFEEQVD